MKKLQKITVFIACTLLSLALHAHDKTMFIPRLISTDQIFELGLTNYQFHAQNIKNIVAIKPFYQNSNASGSLARFFLPNNKKCVTLRENGTGDINSLWLDLISSASTSYSSSLSLKPQRRSAGLIATWYVDCSPYINNLWFGINTAFVHTRHNLHVKECNPVTPGVLDGFTDACDALNNCQWSAGKLSCESQEHTCIDDIQIKMGYDALHIDCAHIAPYVVGVIPTGNRPNADYLFEPLVGSKHGSLGLGLNMDFSARDSLHWMFDAKYNYVFSSTEHRSFDLQNGDWSRYLLVVTQAEPLNTFPGINSFTKSVRVTPGNTFQLWSALHYQRCTWHFELGYNFWLRGKEKVAIKSCAITLPCTQTPIGILDMIRICNPPATTAHSANISQSIVGSNLVVSDAQFTPTTIHDLNLCSATNERMLSNTLYGSFGYELYDSQLLLGLNASYEFTRSFGAISQYAIWGTVEIQF